MADINKMFRELEELTTRYKKAIESLHESEETLELAISGSNGGLWYLKMNPDEPDNIPDDIYLSPALKGFIGFEDNEFPNSVKAWQDRIVREDLSKVLLSAQEHLNGVTNNHKVQYRIYHKDGSIRWIHSRGKILRNEKGKPVKWAGIDWDVTELKRKEDEIRTGKEGLRNLSRSLLDKLEAERHHIARELHDEIGQALTAIKINLQSLQRLSDPLQFKKRLEDSMGIIERTLNQVRNMSLNLRPSLLDDIGLVSTLRWYIDRLSQTTDMKIKFFTDDMEERPPKVIETACFRVAQEALNNVIRHAKTDEVVIRLQKNGKWLQLEVQDYGCGFDVKDAMEGAVQGKSFGLLGMKERVELTGGSIEIKSERQKGTRVTAFFPAENETK